MDDHKSDHDMLHDIYMSMFGAMPNGEDGLLKRFNNLERSLIGCVDPAPDAENGGAGLIPRFNRHIQEHKAWNRRVFVMISVLATAGAAVIDHILNWLGWH